MSITTAMTSVPKPAPELIAAFRDAPTCIISDNLARLPGAVGLRPFHRGGRLVGTAFTVRTRPGDNLAIHQALELVGPGDVIVVDGGGDETQGAGRRDHEEHRRIPRRGGLCDRRRDPRRCGVRCVGLPVLCPRGHTSRPLQERAGRNQRAGFHRRLGDQPGDIVVGDEDGVVSFPASVAATLIEAVRAQIVREEQTLISIREGRYQGSYAKS